MSERIHPGRYAADHQGDIVVFLIGARVNRFTAFRALRLVGRAMPRMLRVLADQPELGLLHAEFFRRGRTTLAVQYWESPEKLHRFATDRLLPHAAAWADFLREVGDSGDVGVYHETYVVPAGGAESLYANMPTFGLAAATRHAPFGEVGVTAARRFAHGRAQVTPA